MSYKIIIPWPPSVLSPNSTKHWRAKASKKKAYRECCYDIASFLPRPRFSLDKIALSFIFHPPSRRRMDLDNALASCKSGLDGIADAWKVNDTRFRPITIDFGEVIKRGRVDILINGDNYEH